jgi:anti-sigma regulatory factor (Ser/Thr protein kinase)
VAQARALVRRELAGHPDTADDAALATSELVTNALTHTRSGDGGVIVLVVITDGPEAAVVGVRDDGGTGEPKDAGADQLAEHGRGLALVAAVTSGWWTQRAGRCRWTWFRISYANDNTQPADSEPKEALR